MKTEKVDIGDEKVDIEDKKIDVKSVLSKKQRIFPLRQLLISKLAQSEIIEPVSGHGKGKYKFKKND